MGTDGPELTTSTPRTGAPLSPPDIPGQQPQPVRSTSAPPSGTSPWHLFPAGPPSSPGTQPRQSCVSVNRQLPTGLGGAL